MRAVSIPVQNARMPACWNCLNIILPLFYLSLHARFFEYEWFIRTMTKTNFCTYKIRCFISSIYFSIIMLDLSHPFDGNQIHNQIDIIQILWWSSWSSSGWINSFTYPSKIFNKLFWFIHLMKIRFIINVLLDLHLDENFR